MITADEPGVERRDPDLLSGDVQGNEVPAPEDVVLGDETAFPSGGVVFGAPLYESQEVLPPVPLHVKIVVCARTSPSEGFNVP